jgi:flagellar protein FlaG
MAIDMATGSVTQVTRITGPAQSPAGRDASQRYGAPSVDVPSTGQAERMQEALQQAVAGLDELAQVQRRSLQFSVDAASGNTVIRVLDAQTQETIRQIPAEEVLNLRRWLRGSAGALLNAKA